MILEPLSNEATHSATAVANVVTHNVIKNVPISPGPVSGFAFSSIPGASWISPIAQVVIGTLLAGFLLKIISDWWHKNIAIPKATAGFYLSQDSRNGAIVPTWEFTLAQMEAQAVGLELWVYLDTKYPFSRDGWDARINVMTEENARIEGVLELQPRNFMIFKGTLPKKTAYKISGSNLIITKPFTNPTTLEVIITINGKIQSQHLTINPRHTT